MTNKNKVRSFAPLPSLSLFSSVYIRSQRQWMDKRIYVLRVRMKEWPGSVRLRNFKLDRVQVRPMADVAKLPCDSGFALSVYPSLSASLPLSVSRFTLLRKSMENRDESDNVLFFFFHTLMWFHLNIRLITVVFKSRIKQVKIRETKI